MPSAMPVSASSIKSLPVGLEKKLGWPATCEYTLPDVSWLSLTRKKTKKKINTQAEKMIWVSLFDETRKTSKNHRQSKPKADRRAGGQAGRRAISNELMVDGWQRQGGSEEDLQQTSRVEAGATGCHDIWLRGRGHGDPGSAEFV